MILTQRFSDALTFAASLHRDQLRKGTSIPYTAHLLAVSATVMEWGGDEDVAIAALLHDAVEDQGGVETADEIRARFGSAVADIVLGCSDSLAATSEKPPWCVRKKAYLDKLGAVDRRIALVTAADKLNNITALVRDVRRDGLKTLDRFNAKPNEMVWYYRAVVASLKRYESHLPWEELAACVEEFAGLISAPPSGALIEMSGQCPRS